MARYARSYAVRRLFLEQLEQGWSPSRAARLCGHTLRTFENWAEEDENFKKDWEDAEATGTDYLEDIARKRAVKGSDSLLTTLLKARRPDKYRERQQVDSNVNISLDGERAKLERKLERALKSSEEGEESSS